MIKVNVLEESEVKVSVLEDSTVKVNVQGQIFNQGQIVQADWNETDENKAGYIKNKPEISNEVITGSQSLVTSDAIAQALLGKTLIQLITWEDDD